MYAGPPIAAALIALSWSRYVFPAVDSVLLSQIQSLIASRTLSLSNNACSKRARVLVLRRGVQGLPRGCLPGISAELLGERLGFPVRLYFCGVEGSDLRHGAALCSLICVALSCSSSSSRVRQTPLRALLIPLSLTADAHAHCSLPFAWYG